MRNPQMLAGFENCNWIRHFCLFFEIACEQLKGRGGIIDLLPIATRNLKTMSYPLISGTQKQILKHWLTMRMSNIFFSLLDDRMIFGMGKFIIESHLGLVIF